jgi:hypothetical protein
LAPPPDVTAQHAVYVLREFEVCWVLLHVHQAPYLRVYVSVFKSRSWKLHML